METPLAKPPDADFDGLQNRDSLTWIRPWPDSQLPLRSTRWQYHAVLFGLAVAVLSASCVLDVEGRQRVIWPIFDLPLPATCTFRSVMGIDCPGCGLTRCFVSLGHGQLLEAWRYNPVGLLLYACAAAQVPYRLVQLWRIRLGRQEWDTGAVGYWCLPAITILLVLQWVARSLSGWSS